MVPDLLPEHLGKLHPFEQLIVIVLAFGPVLLLAATIVIARRRAAAEEASGAGDATGEGAPTTATDRTPPDGSAPTG